MASVLTCLIVSSASIYCAIKMYCQKITMVVPIFKIKVCSHCRLPRDMLAFATTNTSRCMACTPLIKAADKPTEAGRKRLWKAQCSRVRKECKASGVILMRGDTKMLLGVNNQDELWMQLEPKLQPRMTEDNYGQWHVDHVQPVAAFDLRQHDQRQRCFNVSNLKPLWSSDNMAKGSSLLCNLIKNYGKIK